MPGKMSTFLFDCLLFCVLNNVMELLASNSNVNRLNNKYLVDAFPDEIWRILSAQLLTVKFVFLCHSKRLRKCFWANKYKKSTSSQKTTKSDFCSYENLNLKDSEPLDRKYQLTLKRQQNPISVPLKT